MQLNVNTDAAVIYSNKLERMHKSALPVAVRGTLNKAAFNVKQSTLLTAAKTEFIQRSPNFFKAFSKVDMAKGFDLRTMKSTVGMTEQGLKGDKNFAVRDLEEQEHGGRIKGRSFIPTNISRGGSNSRPVRPGNRITTVKKIANSAKAKGKNRQEKFIKSAIHAGVGGHVIGNFQKGVLWRITSIKKRKVNLRGRSSNTVVKAKALFTFQKNRSVKIKETGFMKKASLVSANKIEDFYIEEAKRQIEKLQNK